MSTRTCHHVHANGALCKSPPLSKRDYCHFHLDQIGRQLRAARARARHQPARLKLPLLEDPFAVQVALMQVADAIVHNEIDAQRGRLLMSVLRLASRNLTAARAWKHDALFAAGEDANTEWPGFEQENELPPDFDLTVDPEVAFPPSQENSTDAANIPGAAMYGHDGLPLPLREGWDDARDADLRARLRQALGEAKEFMPTVTADQVELMDIYQRDGNDAGKKFADRLVRNDLRRERRLQRAHYEEVARNHTIRLAASRLLEQQQREAKQAATASANAQQTAGDAHAAADESQQKKPVSGVAAEPGADASKGSGVG